MSMTQNDIDPADCPDPSVHGNPFRYCPYCNWMEAAPTVSLLHQAMLDAGWTDRQIGAAMDAAAAEGFYDD